MFFCLMKDMGMSPPTLDMQNYDDFASRDN